MIEGISLRLVASITPDTKGRLRPLRDKISYQFREPSRGYDQAYLEKISVTKFDELACAASELLTMRRRRDTVLSVSDAAWELLLIAFSAHPNVVQTKAFCAGSAVPEATVIRWLQYLEGRMLLEKAAHPIRRDQRATYYRLSEAGCFTVGHALRAMLQD